MKRNKSVVRSSIQKNGIVGKELGYTMINGMKIKNSDLTKELIETLKHHPKDRDKS